MAFRSTAYRSSRAPTDRCGDVFLDFKSFELSVRISGPAPRSSRPDPRPCSRPTRMRSATAALARTLRLPIRSPCPDDVQPGRRNRDWEPAQPTGHRRFAPSGKEQKNLRASRSRRDAGQRACEGASCKRASLRPRSACCRTGLTRRALTPMDRMNPLRAEWGIPADRFVALVRRHLWACAWDRATAGRSGTAAHGHAGYVSLSGTGPRLRAECDSRSRSGSFRT